MSPGAPRPEADTRPAAGLPEGLEGPPARVVSLVPSLTEALFALGLGERVVGVTDWCVHPADGVAPLPKLGGTKDPDLEAVVALRPDLVIANHEENTRRVVERLRAAGLRVWVTYPRTVREGAHLLRELAALGAPPQALAEVVEPVERAVAEAERDLPESPARVFCPIWREPWMTIGPETYIHAMLALSGGENVFAKLGGRRYPRVSKAQIEAAAPEVILLPDEPYPFGERDVRELEHLDTPAGRDGRIHCIDGTWVSWYGPRIRPALAALRRLLAPAGFRA